MKLYRDLLCVTLYQVPSNVDPLKNMPTSGLDILFPIMAIVQIAKGFSESV